jgi:hypothetical protein
LREDRREANATGESRAAAFWQLASPSQELTQRALPGCLRSRRFAPLPDQAPRGADRGAK